MRGRDEWGPNLSARHSNRAKILESHSAHSAATPVQREYRL